MMQLLVSVKNLEEAMLALESGADIIDMKDPENGALGALPFDTIQAIVRAVDGRVPTSATVGDWHGDVQLLVNRLKETEKTGVDYIKLEYHQSLDDELWEGYWLKSNNYGAKLIAMFLVDKDVHISYLRKLKALGFHGVMFDTESKTGLSLLDYFSAVELSQFSGVSKQERMMVGFAGSLRGEHVELLSETEADFLGFRGGLCQQFNRRNTLSTKKILDVKKVLQKNNTHM